jgi:S1-C subfamily serine protease
VSLDVQGEEESHGSDGMAGMIDPEKNRIPRLGIIGLGIDKDTAAMFPDLRGAYGVVVAAKSPGATTIPTGLEVGDVIHEINGSVVEGVDGLRSAIDNMKQGDAVALFVERDSTLLYISFEVE